MMPYQQAVNYAKALFSMKGSQEEVQYRQCALEQIGVAITKRPELIHLLTYPQWSIEKKLSMFGPLDPQLKKLVELLVKRRKIGIIRQIATEYHKLVVDKLEEIDVEVTTAQPLTEAESQILKSIFKNRLHKTVNLLESVDVDLLGGFTLLAHNQFMDLSLRGKLKELKKHLLKVKV